MGVVPWKYDVTIMIDEKDVKMKDEVVKSDVTNITRVSRMTLSGLFFSSESIKVKISKSSEWSSDEKVVLGSNQEPNPANKGIPLDEVDEFLKIIKISEYKVVDQLH